MRRPIVTKRSTAKTDAPHPRHSAKACDNNTQTTWRFGKDWQQSLLLQAGLETFNQQPCSPGSWRSVGFEKALLLLKLCQFWQKGHCRHFRCCKQLNFLDSKKRSSPERHADGHRHTLRVLNLVWSACGDWEPNLLWQNHNDHACLDALSKMRHQNRKVEVDQKSNLIF